MARAVVDDDAGPPGTGLVAPRRQVERAHEPGTQASDDRRHGRFASRPLAHAPALDYRPALDGLRAVAVLVVMAEHADLRMPGSGAAAVPGGFLGVDVFFVISGFLITSLLLVERRRSGRVDLRSFWLRRARRLLPAAGVVIAGTAVLVKVADLPVDGASVRGDALAALAYVANWRFVITDQSYFASFGLPSPFRHLWSLSLEEQWYVVFPPVLVGLIALLRRPAALLGVLLAAAAASAVWMAMLYTPGTDPSRVYYGTDTRAHTLLVGAALAVVMVHFPGPVRRIARVAPVLGVAGLVALAVVFHTVDSQQASLYRGGFAVVALASAATIAGVALPGAAGPVWWLLGRRLPVLVGRLSYGLYLWHWPVYVWLTPERAGVSGYELVALRLAVSFTIAGVSYVLVEQPIRRHGLGGIGARMRRMGLPALRPAVVTAVAGTAVTAIVFVATGGRGTSAVMAAGGSPTTIAAGGPVTTVVVDPGHPLPAVPTDRDLQVMIAGDSVGWSLGFPFSSGGQPMPEGIAIRTVANLGCTVTPGVALLDGVRFEPRFCMDWHPVWQAEASQMQPDVVVTVWGAWEVYDHMDGDRRLRAGTREAGTAYQGGVAATIDETVAVAPNTRFVFLTVPCMEERTPRLGGTDSPRNDPEMLAWVNDHTREVVAGYGGRAKVVDLGPLVCPGGEAVDEVDGVTARDDGVHFSSEFAPAVWDFVEERIRPWLARPAIAERPVLPSVTIANGGRPAHGR